MKTAETIMDKDMMINKVAWLGKFEAFHKIGEYSFVEFHPTVYDDVSPVIPRRYHEFTYFSPFINGKDIGMHYDSLDAALAGVIAFKYDGANSRAAEYFMKAIKPQQ